MSSDPYAALTASIINKNGEGSKYAGLNHFFDVKRAFDDATRKYQFDAALKQQEGFSAGLSHIYGSAAMTGVPVDPLAVQDYAKSVQMGPSAVASGQLNQDSQSLMQNPSNPNVSVTDTPGNPNGITVTSSPASDRNEAVLSKYTPALQARIKAIADYKQPIGSMRQLNAIGGIVSQYDPNFDANQYKERQSFIQGTWDKGDLSKQRQATENVVQHAVTYQQYQNALANGDLRTANAIKNQFALETGNPNITNAATFARVVGVEAAKALSPNGVLTDEQARENSKNFPENASPAQSTAAIQNVIKIMQPRMNTILEKYKERMGKYPDNGFTPEFVNALKLVSPEVYNNLASKLKVNGVYQDPIPAPDNLNTTSSAGSTSGSAQQDPLGIR